MRGMVFAVCTSPVGGIPKFPQSEALVGEHGLVGDYHNRPLRPSYSKPGTKKPNEWHISLLAEEVIRYLNTKRKDTLAGMKELLAGSLGENITTQYLWDLSSIPNGSRIKIGSGLVLEVVEPMTPCKVIGTLHPQLVKEIYGIRGLYAKIISGVGTAIKPHDSIEIVY